MDAVIIISIVALCTIITRFLPFLVFGKTKSMPKTVDYLGKVLPSAIMAILVVYCLKSINIFQGNRGIPEILSVVLVALLHIWKKNTLLSISVGTIFYMFLVQAIFL